MIECNVYFRGRSTEFTLLMKDALSRSADFVLRLETVPYRKGTQFSDAVLLGNSSAESISQEMSGIVESGITSIVMLSDCSIEMRRYRILGEVDDCTLGEINDWTLDDLDYVVIS